MDLLKYQARCARLIRERRLLAARIGTLCAEVREVDTRLAAELQRCSNHSRRVMHAVREQQDAAMVKAIIPDDLLQHCTGGATV